MGSRERNRPVAPERDDLTETVIIPTGVSEAVVSAFEEVDRAQFMYRASRDKAYIDKIIDISKEATISQPSLVALMLDLLHLEGHEKVLELGTATGYQAALLSRLAGHVDTIEIDSRLAYWAESNLKRLHYPNVTVHTGDGARGLEQRAPFDAIIITAGLREVPPPLIDQLVIGGRIIAPIGELPENSRLVVLTKISESEVKKEDHGYCGFVPLYSSEEGGWTTETLNEIRQKGEQEREAQLIDRRTLLRQALIEDYGLQAYRRFIDYIGRSAAQILVKELKEEQVLDLFDFFAGVFNDDKESDETSTENSDGLEGVAGMDSYGTNLI